MSAQCIWKLSDRQDLTDERNDVRTAFFVGKIMMQKQFMVTQGKEKLRFQQIIRLKGNKFQWEQQGMIVYARNCGTHKMNTEPPAASYSSPSMMILREPERTYMISTSGCQWTGI